MTSISIKPEAPIEISHCIYKLDSIGWSCGCVASHDQHCQLGSKHVTDCVILMGGDCTGVLLQLYKPQLCLYRTTNYH